MPQKRGAVAARYVPSSRLPIGTPTVTISSQRTSSRNTQHSSDFEVASRDSVDTKSSTSVNMSRSRDFSNNPASLAQAKLLRQQERIQQAEAALNNPPPIEKLPIKSIWRQSDIDERVKSRGSGNEASIEVRVNKYTAAPPRAHSLSRSLSSVSQQTTFGGGEPDDSTNDDAGFQVWTRRGGRGAKAPGESNTYNDKPDIEKQKTVEAAYDKNEILGVFKQALPAPDFLGTTPGARNGQVQFVQHPNGDVAAHMWSASNWMWDNIGHFSNIRKRTEGQLAGERLKGETAYQKLQQHTLAYFRILAKQREATVTGTVFGQENIKSALPEPISIFSPTASIVAVSKKPLQSPAVSQSWTSRPPEPFVQVVRQRQDDPFSTDTNDYSNAFHWQSRFGPSSTSFAGQSVVVNSERRHQVSSDSTPTREALRDQLHKTVDIATKRSLSQANIARTVLYDPVQAASSDEQRHEPGPAALPAQSLHPSWQEAPAQPSHSTHLLAARKTSGLNIGSVPDMDEAQPIQTSKLQDNNDRLHYAPAMQHPPVRVTRKSYDDELKDWWTGGSKFARQEELFRTIIKTAPPRSSVPMNGNPARVGAIGSERNSSSSDTASDYNEFTTRLFIPIYENLASYVQGAPRQNYWSRFSEPPDWCIDRGPNGNNSFFDHNWGQPPARLGRDPRFRHDRGDLQFGNLSPMASTAIGSPEAQMSRFGLGRY